MPQLLSSVEVDPSALGILQCSVQASPRQEAVLFPFVMLFVRSFEMLRPARGYLQVVVRGRLKVSLHQLESFVSRGLAVLVPSVQFFGSSSWRSSC